MSSVAAIAGSLVVIANLCRDRNYGRYRQADEHPCNHDKEGSQDEYEACDR